MKELRSFLLRFLRHRGRIGLGVLAIPVVVLCEIRLTLLVGDTLDRLKEGDEELFLGGVFLAMLGIGLAQGVAHFVKRWFIVGVSRRVEVEVKQQLFDKLTRLPMSFHAQSRSGDIVSRLTSDVENVRMLLGPGTMYSVEALCLGPGALWVLWQLSPRVAMGMAVPLIAAAFFVRWLTPRLHGASLSVQESLAAISHRAQESFSGIRVVKGYGLAGHEEGGFRAVSETNREHQIRMASARGQMHSLFNLCFELSFIPILVVGGWAMIDRTIALGDLFKFLDLGLKLSWPVMALGWISGMYPRAVASADRIESLLAAPVEIDDPRDPVRPAHPEGIAGALELRDVSFTYEGAPTPAVTGVTLSVPAGSTLGVVGPTGAGKTTLLELIGRIHEPRGELLLDRVPVSRMPLETLRGAVAYVPQDSFLFSDTYRNNLDFGSDTPLTNERLAEVIELAGMTDEVAAFPDGLEQLIGERGVTLSGGQRQRTCIARALAKGAPVLVLDDALSAVDTETEARLLRSLRSAGQDRTVVVAAHRLATVRHADRILILRRGRVEAQGTHEELLERSDWYRSTWERQRMMEELEEL